MTTAIIITDIPTIMAILMTTITTTILMTTITTTITEKG